MPHLYANKDDALYRANVKFDELKRKQVKLTFTTVGNPNILTETPIRLLSGVDDLPKYWIVDSVTHTLNNSGFTTKVVAYKLLSTAKLSDDK